MARASIQVRPAVAADAAALARLMCAADASAPVSGRQAVTSTRARVQQLDRILADEARVLLVATTEDGTDESAAVVGLLAGRIDEIGVLDLTPVLQVTHLLVLPGARRRGVGRALLCAAVQIAEAAGVGHVLAAAGAGSREGNRYLARMGFAPLVTQRLAAVPTLRRSLGMTDSAARVAVLRRARTLRAQRAGFAAQPLGRGA